MDQDGSPQEAGAGGAGTPPTASGGEGQASMSPKKRRKVNHGRPKNEHDTAAGEDEAGLKQEDTSADGMPPSIDQQQADHQLLQDTGLAAPSVSTASTARPRDPSQLVQPSPGPGGHARTLDNSNNQRYLGYSDWSLGGQNQFQDMHNFHPSYMFNAPEVTNEYNLLNDFLSTSLLDDGAIFSGDDAQSLYSDPALINTVAANTNGSNAPYIGPQLHNQFAVPQQASNAQGSSIPRPKSAMPTEQDRETYYMTAADPSGSDAPEERMNKLLKAKYDAGMLRPFNYVKGYARLNQYMDQNMQPASRQKILRQLDRFRPKFRERMQTLTDIELVLVEMWFERGLMEYDRVFASMAIPACCWRRTGEIFRGNKEMAELIHVPIEELRDVRFCASATLIGDGN
ncbi:MAG: hypothetical protein LQ347_000551 [Umbilicaria vellea]|nr:MAG: hypothetical protein LQ347_000551 [Umbilicaria vellea]